MSHVCHVTLAFKVSGQNLGQWGKFDNANKMMKKVINEWYIEVGKAKQKDLDKCCSVAGHYTQIVADRSTAVGCAIAAYDSQSQIVCNYAFTNMGNQPIYVSGKPASGCKTGTNPRFSALCSTKENIKP